MSAKTNCICETERLYLRELNTNDAAFAFELNNDTEVLKYTGDAPFKSIEAAEEFLMGYNHYCLYGFGRWGVLRKSDDEILGWCGLKYDAERREHDIGYRFKREYWNMGYATEAGKACVDMAFERFNIKLLYGNVVEQNYASQKVLEKIGLQRLPECGRTAAELRYLITKKMWELSKSL